MALNPFIWDRPLDDPVEDRRDGGVRPRGGADAQGRRPTSRCSDRAIPARPPSPTSSPSSSARSHGDDAPPFDVVKINLQRVVSLPGFIGCVHDAMVSHPVKHLRRAAQRQIGALEKEIGFDIRVIKGSVRRPAAHPEQDAETLHAQLVTLRALSDHLVVIFDEFQRLRHCPGDPLAIIRSALMSSGANHVSLLFTGSIRNALKMMIEDSSSRSSARQRRSSCRSSTGPTSSSTSTSSSRRPASRPTSRRSNTCSTPRARTRAAPSSSPGRAGRHAGRTSRSPSTRSSAPTSGSCRPSNAPSTPPS